MPNQVFLKEGEQQTDEKVALVIKESQLEPALPPLPPPSIPSSSSSLLPSSSHDPAHLNLDSAASSSSGDPVAAQFAQLFPIIGRLSSENEGLKARVGHLSSTVSRLSSEHESKGAFIRQLEAKVFPDGFWVWEKLGDGGGKGRWRWSQDQHYRPPSAVKTGPPTSFGSLPVEILRIIFKFARRREQSRLTRLSFRLLEVFGPLLYATVELQTPESAITFVVPRISAPNPSTSRVTPFLTPSQLVLRYRTTVKSDLEYEHDIERDRPPFHSLTRRLPRTPLPINISKLTIESYDMNLHPDISTWSPFLKLLRPVDLTLRSAVGSAWAPSFQRGLTPSHFTFIRLWHQLRSVTSIGLRTVFVRSGRSEEAKEEGSLWEQSFDEESQVAGLESWLRAEFSDGRTEEKVIHLDKSLDTFVSPPHWDNRMNLISIVLKKKEVGVRGGTGI